MSGRETYTSRLTMLITMVGVAVGLGNVWRFPYMVGRYGGAPFVLVYVAAVFLVGIPALMAEWSLGRQTRLGTVGAFRRAGMPGGRAIGWLLFAAVTGGMAYYTNAVGWVLYHAIAQVAALGGATLDAGRILPPASGFDGAAFALQLVCSAAILGSVALIVQRGLRRGIERASGWIMPLLLGIVLVLVVRALTLPGAWAGVEWYILKFDPAALDGRVVLGALGQAVFSLSLGGTFMVVYGSYLGDEADLRRTACWTAAGDLGAGLLAGLAIFPAVLALGLDPAHGPGLLFSTLPEMFERMPFGALFGALFFVGLFAAAYLSAVAGLEVMVAGVTDNTRLRRGRAVWLMAGLVLLFGMLPMLSMAVFVPWDLTFGSGMQTLGALLSVVCVGWAMDRSAALEQLGGDRRLVVWIRYAVPVLIVAVWVWWALTELFGVVAAP